MMFLNKPSGAGDIARRSQMRATPITSAIRTSSAARQFLGVGVLGFIGSVALGLMFTDAMTLLGVFIGAGFYSIALWVAFAAFGKTYPHAALGWCNTVTLFRLMLVSVLVAWLITPGFDEWLVVAFATLVFLLDGLDGWLARREGYVSDFGARFDMEVDSALALVLALHAYLSGSVGVYVIALGLPRYMFIAAHHRMPWLAGDLPPRFSRKAVCVLQIAVLIAVLLPMVRSPLSDAIVYLTAVAVIWSFWLDGRWLWRARS